MKLYYETVSKDRIGNKRYSYRCTEEYATKAALKKAKQGWMHVTKVWSEEQASDWVKQNAKAY